MFTLWAALKAGNNKSAMVVGVFLTLVELTVFGFLALEGIK